MAVSDQFRAVERQIGKRAAVQALRPVRQFPPHPLRAVGVVYAVVLRLEAIFGIPYTVRCSLGHKDHRPRAFATNACPTRCARAAAPPPRIQFMYFNDSVPTHIYTLSLLDAQSGRGHLPTHLSSIR